MLRNRSRAVTSKQALMSDQTPLFLSPTKNSCSPISYFLNSPRFFNGFLSKSVFDSETMSPTSILDYKNSANSLNPFTCDTAPPPNPHHDFAAANKSIGLALIDSIADDWSGGDCRFSKPINRLALFGSKLKVQIPEISSSISTADDQSPGDFGIKTRSSQLSSPFGGGGGGKDLARQLSLKEMEMSEDYTCVIKHGPNPKTRHIYDDCILDDDDVSPPQIQESHHFLSFCHACKAVLQQDKDIYMYRGEKAFCSQECRCQEMIFEGMENPGTF
ncbi:FCS-Like Zinc finger 8-like [Salvia miltiorrhiza]|uniref:FCS-Like Zinc finger 8-like n=1 Tax=Salvia miltiorrhiza TaxID=226208 RepID=UPI0025ABB4B1|nr:FCS-Like Zinc finger 8-like [Salvia miltiorrhiza]